MTRYHVGFLSVSAVLLSSALFLSSSLLHNAFVFTTEIVPTSDAAADTLLIDRIVHGDLFVGHYSRFGFNHPGPFFLYARYLGELCLGPFLPGPFNGQVVAILALSSFFMGLGISGALDFRSSGWSGLAAVPIVVAAILVLERPWWITSIWMPHVVAAPFFAFLMLLAGTARGRWGTLPWTTLCGAALAHGYASLVPFVALSWPLAVGLGFWHHRDGMRKPLIASCVMIVFFIAPVALDAIVHPPGNLWRIIEIMQRQAPDQGRTWGKAATYLAAFWTLPALAAWPLSIVAACIAMSNRSSRKTISYASGSVAVATVFTIVYLRFAPGELLDYIASYYLVTPLSLIACSIGCGIAMISGKFFWTTSLIGAIAAIAAAIYVNPGGTYSGDPAVRVLSRAIASDVSARGERMAWLRSADWPMPAGVLVELSREGTLSCIDQPNGAFLFTPYRICHGLPATQYTITTAEECEQNCLARAGGFGVAVAPR
jgi:hypothetical protein